jgi:hypothetical protein
MTPLPVAAQADPDDEVTGFAESERGVSFIFGKDVVVGHPICTTALRLFCVLGLAKPKFSEL